MICDTNTIYFGSGANRSASPLEGLTSRQRDAVRAALRQSVESGFPACSEGLRILVDYALGEITASQYAGQMIVALGFAQGRAPLELVPPAAPLQQVAPAAPVSPVSKKVSRDDAVQAYVTGQISVEEFLRLSRMRSA